MAGFSGCPRPPLSSCAAPACRIFPLRTPSAIGSPVRERAQLDYPVPRDRMSGRDFDRLVQVSAIEKIEAGGRGGEFHAGATGDGKLVASHGHGRCRVDRSENLALETNPAALHLLDPSLHVATDIASDLRRYRDRLVAADQHQDPHGASSVPRSGLAKSVSHP